MVIVIFSYPCLQLSYDFWICTVPVELGYVMSLLQVHDVVDDLVHLWFSKLCIEYLYLYVSVQSNNNSKL